MPVGHPDPGSPHRGRLEYLATVTSPESTELPVRLFKDDAAWEAWLAKQHARSAGVWLRIAKAASKVKGAETRAKKIEQLVGMLERHEVIHA